MKRIVLRHLICALDLCDLDVEHPLECGAHEVEGQGGCVTTVGANVHIHCGVRKYFAKCLFN